MESANSTPLALFVAGVTGGASPRFNEDEVAVLAHVNSKVAAGETLADILDFVFNETRSIMPCDRIGVAFIGTDRIPAFSLYTSGMNTEVSGVV
jgi:hypothetical protein